MSGKKEISPFIYGVHSQIVELAETDFYRIVQSSLQLFIEDGFLQQIFSKNSKDPVDKAALLINRFCEAANLKNFLEQSKSDESDSDENTEDNNTDIMIEDIPATPIMPTPIPVQSTSTEFPDLGSKKSDNEVTHILTGYTPLEDEQQRVREIVVYDISYTWSLEHLLAELKLWGNTIEVSIKRQHKYKTLQIKIALSLFALPQLSNYWITDLGDTLIVHRSSAESSTSFRDFTVHRDKVRKALCWLKRNNRYYANIIIDDNILCTLPDKGSIDDLLPQVHDAVNRLHHVNYESCNADRLDSETDNTIIQNFIPTFPFT
ncbi:hypothetical protein C1646_765130 [Rhizophagus diaphanus]|nr:hypothetical protein C1646_765130 [Rhizophagus diaphanus] [Rhizophagus sp. MUCL 43196]